LIYPLYDISGKVTAYQRIYNNGDKKINGTKSGSFFIVGGSIENRAWIAEGLATALTVHAATSEPVIVAVDAGNIGKVSKTIKAKYQQLELLSAADNDCHGENPSYAGKKAAESAGLRYAMPNFSEFEDAISRIENPKERPTDFNDLLAYSDIGTVQRQLKKITGIQYQEINQKYLGFNHFEPGLTAIKSAKNTGKTTCLKSALGDVSVNEKTLIITHRVLLNEQLAKELNADFYQDLLEQGKVDNHFLRTSKRLVITPHSLLKLRCTKWHTIIIDEVEQVLGELIHNNDYFKGRRLQTLSLLQALLIHSDRQILLDADLSETTVNFCHRTELSGRIYNNTYQSMKGATIYLYDSREQLTAEMLKRVEYGAHIYFASNSKTLIDRITEQVPAGVNSVSLTGDTESKDKFEFVEGLSQGTHEIDFLLTSPAAGTGLNISTHTYDATFGDFSYNVNSVEDCLQHINRVRNIKDFHIYIDHRKTNALTNQFEIKRNLLNMPLEDTAELLQLDPRTLRQKISSPELEALYCDVMAKRNLSLIGFKSRFIELAKSEGYEIKYAAIDNDAKAAQREKDKQIKAAELNKLSIAIKKAGLLSEDDFNLGQEQNDKVSYMKTKISLMLKLPDGEELNRYTMAEIETGYVKRLEPLILAYLGIVKTTQLDLFDVNKEGADITSLKFYSQRGKLYTKLLSFAGISPLLEYNGTKWYESEMNKLKQFLLNNKTKLESYKIVKNVELSRRKPTRFLNEFIRNIDQELLLEKRARKGGKVQRVYGIDGEVLAITKDNVTNIIDYKNNKK